MNEAIRDNRKNDSPNADEEYRALLRALRRKRGFGLFFVQASPGKGREILQQLQTDLPTKRIETVKLERTSERLFEQLDEVWQQQPVDVFWIEGLEQSLLGYEDIKRLAGWETQDLIHYSWQDVPPILAHLNLGRERFAQRFTCALVFVVPLFVVKYLLRRASDFFDWKSGFFEFPEDVYGAVQDFVAASDYETCKNLDPAVRTQRILEIKSCLERLSLDIDEQTSLYWQMGCLLTLESNYEAALWTYDKVLVLRPEDPNSWYFQGNSLYRLGRCEEAVESYDKALALQLENPDAWNFRGLSLSRLGRDEEAIESYDKVLALQPDFYSAWGNRGFSLYLLGRYKEAIESYDKVLALQPDFYPAWNSRAFSLYLLGRDEEAIESYDKVLALQPDFYLAWYKRGDSLANLGRYEAAITSYDKALEIKPDEEYIWFWKAKTLARMGRSEDAISSYEKVLEIQPNHSVACHNRALALAGIGRYEEAIIGFKKAIELKSDSSSATSWMCLGGALLRMGRYEESLASLDKAIEIRGKGRHWEWGGRVISLLKLGRFREAFVSSYKSLLSFKLDSGFREWVERRIAIDLIRFGLQKLVPVWTKFLSLIRWRVKNW